MYPDDRYHLTHPDTGLLETCASKIGATARAAKLAQRLGSPVTIYDAMARRGCDETWEVDEHGRCLYVRRREAT